MCALVKSLASGSLCGAGVFACVAACEDGRNSSRKYAPGGTSDGTSREAALGRASAMWCTSTKVSRKSSTGNADDGIRVYVHPRGSPYPRKMSCSHLGTTASDGLFIKPRMVSSTALKELTRGLRLMRRFICECSVAAPSSRSCAKSREYAQGSSRTRSVRRLPTGFTAASRGERREKGLGLR